MTRDQLDAALKRQFREIVLVVGGLTVLATAIMVMVAHNG
jgi:hypothetical protein